MDPVLNIPGGVIRAKLSADLFDLFATNGQAAAMRVQGPFASPAYRWQKNDSFIGWDDIPEAGSLDLFVAVGQAATMTVQGSFALATYQWQKNDGFTGWINVSGATSSEYTTPSLALTNTGDVYRCVVHHLGGRTITGPYITYVGYTGTTYYVDNTRPDDSGDGLTPSTAWKTVAQVNGFTFALGDRVRFRRSQGWAESLICPQDQMFFGAYGDGDQPVFDGQSTAALAVTAGGKDRVTFSDLTAIDGATDCFNSGGVGSNKTVYVRCVGTGSGDQNFQLSSPGWCLYCAASGAVDDGISGHAEGHVIGGTYQNNNQNAQFILGTAFYAFDATFGGFGASNVTLDGSITSVVDGCNFTHGGVALPSGGILRNCLFDAQQVSTLAGSILARSTIGGPAWNIENCTFWARGVGRGSVDAWGETANFYNCVFDDIYRVGYTTGAGAINCYNCCFNSVEVENGIVVNQNRVDGVPEYVDALGGNFMPTATSILRAAGTNRGIELDKFGVPWHPTTPSIGALEYDAAA